MSSFDWKRIKLLWGGERGARLVNKKEVCIGRSWMRINREKGVLRSFVRVSRCIGNFGFWFWRWKLLFKYFVVFVVWVLYKKYFNKLFEFTLRFFWGLLLKNFVGVGISRNVYLNENYVIYFYLYMFLNIFISIVKLIFYLIL